jgi:hypothetical protein
MRDVVTEMELNEIRFRYGMQWFEPDVMFVNDYRRLPEDTDKVQSAKELTGHTNKQYVTWIPPGRR